MKKYNSLKHMSPEEKKEYKRKQKAIIQARYYKRHKEEIKARNNGRYNYSRKYKNALERLSNYINSNDKLNKQDLLDIISSVNVNDEILYRRNYSFMKKGIDMDRVNTQLLEVISNLSFEEICKMFREICYDQVCYYSEDSKGIIYKTDRSNINKEQACRLQRKVSTAIDLYAQSVVDAREFEEDYLTERLGL